MFTGEDPSEELLDELGTIQRYMRDGYPDEVDSWLIARKPVPWRGAIHLDGSGSLHHQYGAGLPRVFIVRPDNYLGFRSLGTEALPVLEFLGTFFDAEPKLPAV